MSGDKMTHNEKNVRIVGIKYLRGKDIDGVVRLKKEIMPNDIVKRVITENSPRDIDYLKSDGRIVDFISSFKGSKTY